MTIFTKRFKILFVALVAFLAVSNRSFAQNQGKVLKVGDVYILDKAKLSAQDEKKVIELLKEKPELGHYKNQDGSATYGTKDMLSLTKAQKQILSDNNFNTSAIWFVVKSKGNLYPGPPLALDIENISAIMKKYQ